MLDSDYASAQWKANLYGGYGFDDKMDYSSDNGKYFNATAKGSALYGGGIEYILKSNYGLELMYMREDTEVSVAYSPGEGLGDSSSVPEVSFNCVFVSGNGYTEVGDSRVEPFGSVLLGIAIMNKKNNPHGSGSSMTRFAYGFRAGVNIVANDLIGFKIMGQLISVTNAFDSEFYLGNAGSEYSLKPEASMLQFSALGGITFRLGK